jgi:starvation-inducible DNA-binding protein
MTDLFATTAPSTAVGPGALTPASDATRAAPARAFATRHDLAGPTRAAMATLLGGCLVEAIALERHAKQAHWNVKGMHFRTLHALFDDVAEEAKAWSDLLAERLVALGGVADGRVETVAARSTLPALPEAAVTGQAWVAALADSLAAFGVMLRRAIDVAAAGGDVDTADVCTEVSRGADTRLWMVEAHGQDAPVSAGRAHPVPESADAAPPA